MESMQVEPRITFRGVRASEGLSAEVLSRLEKLERYAPRLVGARVTVEFVGRHHRAGNRYRVTVALDMPGETIVVRQGPSLRAAARAAEDEVSHKQDEVDPGHRFAKVAVREAFEAARRQLQDYVRRQRGAVKAHAPKPTPAAARGLRPG